MNIDHAFHLYDIRGPYPEVVDERLAFLLGHALQNLKQPKKICVAGDIRASTPKLKKYLLDGFADGLEILDLGEVPIPEFYFTVASLNVDLGVMITASHLHANENGFKIVGENSQPLDQKELQRIKLDVKRAINLPIVVPRRTITQVDETENYITALIKAARLDQTTLKLVLDTTRSSTTTVVPILFKKLGSKYSLVKSNHEGNPLLPENRRDLVKMVRENGADLGIIWDSDGDRVVFLDRNADYIPVSFVLALLGSQSVKENAGGVVATDVRAGLVVRDEVQAAGGKVEVYPSWHTTLKFAMQENPKIIFAGENSGHIIYKDFFSFDDGLFAALKFIDYCQKNNLQANLARLKNRYFEIPEMNIPCPPEKSIAILDKLADHYRAENLEISLIDGLTVFGPDWKFNLRESATEPLLRLNLETKSEEIAGRILAHLQKELS